MDMPENRDVQDSWFNKYFALESEFNDRVTLTFELSVKGPAQWNDR